MQITGLLRTITLSVVIMTPVAAHANFANEHGAIGFNNDCINDDVGNHWKNASLSSGSYSFADYHKPGQSFFDTWSFSLAQTSDVVVNLFDLLTPTSGPNNLVPNQNGLFHRSEHSANDLMKSLLDNKYLTVSLFDQDGNLMGTAGENGMLSAFGLGAGEKYTLGVSGKAAGLLGGLYYGNLNVESAPAVPLGDSFALFASALAVLGLRSKKVIGALRR